MVTVNQITPISIPSLDTASTLTGNEYAVLSQLNTSVKCAVASLPQGFTAGVVTFGTSGGSPFPNYRTLKAGAGVTIVDAGAQADLTISFNSSTSTVAWGNIIGTLSSQTDLQTALNAKLAIANNLSDVADTTTSLNNLLPSQTGNNGKLLSTNGTNTSWSSAATGTITGPVSSTDTAIAVWNGTTGTVIKNSSVLVGANGTITGAIISGATNTITSISLTTGITGILQPTNGGTGNASYATGDILYASNGTTLSTLADVATGNALISGGVTTVPSYGKIGLTTHISGVLSPANGGSGIANNALSTVTRTGNFPTTITVSGTTAVTLPTAGTLATTAGTETLTNKRITKRTGTTTSSATPTINTDNVDFYSLTAQAADITSFTTNLSGTPTEAQNLWIAITGTATRNITWGGSFESSTVTLPSATVSTNRLDVGFVWNSVANKFRCVATA